MALRRCFVQFIHPGPEHGPSANGIKEWNLGDHARKFMLADGECVERPSSSPKRGPIVFWGEWEPESQVRPAPGKTETDAARWLHEPYYVRPAVYRRDGHALQNTDPFVFGDRFLYTLCRQWKTTRGRWRPTFLRDLAEGSLILFGSLKSGEFVMDTVFVVGESVLHTGDTWHEDLASRVTGTYADVTLWTMYAGGSRDEQFRLYLGATHQEPIEGMFSFVPCLPAPEAIRSFSRPSIRLPGMVTPGLMMGVKATRDVSLAEQKGAWDAVVEQVISQGLALGTRLPEPPMRGVEAAPGETAAAVPDGPGLR